MNKLFPIFLIAIMIVASGATALAQNNSGQRLSREELAAKQAQYIAHELALDDSTANKYMETYCQYQREVWTFDSHKRLTTEQRLDRSQKILDLRKKYYHIYTGFLSEPQIDKAYRLEKRLLDRIGKAKAKAKGKGKANGNGNGKRKKHRNRK